MNVFGEMRSTVEIRVTCQNLINKDTFSKSDPFVVLFTKPTPSSPWVEHSRTETIKNNLNPTFIKALTLDYYFEQHQPLKFEVYDSDSDEDALSHHDFLGKTEITFGSLVGEHCGQMSMQLQTKKNAVTKSIITLNAEELNSNNNILKLCFRGRKLDKKDFFGKSDPYLKFYRQGIEDTSKGTMVHKTEVIKNTLNPVWREFTLPLTTLCNGDKERNITIECFDWDRNGSHDFIGGAKTTVADLLSKKHSTLDLWNPIKKSKSKSGGTLELVNIEEIIVPSFLDYVMGGTELCFHVAVDFTASNGNPMQVDSLHYINPHVPNQYMQALLNVGKICEDYDTDKLIPAYGFGAKMNGQTYHNFNLNYTLNPTCYGINGVIAAYQSAIQKVELYGPTNFTPIIRVVSGEVAQNSVNKYHILLIITDGVISDPDHTVSAIIDASRLPMSIIIVGVGNADFTAMEILDADDGVLTQGIRRAERDIVQFVPFLNFTGPDCGPALARAVLEELPDQLVKYMMSRNIKPQPRLQQQGGVPQGPPPAYS